MDLLNQEERYFFCIKKVIPLVKKTARITKKKIQVIELKSHGNFVTNIDKEIEQSLKLQLLSLLPNSGFVAEESGDSNCCCDYQWIIDPIDGTTNYIYGFPYTISVALKSTLTSELLIGVVYNPTQDVVYFGCKGKGSYSLNNEKIIRLKVGKFPNDEGISIFGMPYDRSKTDKILQIVNEYYKISSDMKRIGPASLDICKVASGEAKLYFELDLNIWDVSAGILILKEAGGDYAINGDLIVFFSDIKFLLPNIP